MTENQKCFETNIDKKTAIMIVALLVAIISPIYSQYTGQDLYANMQKATDQLNALSDSIERINGTLMQGGFSTLYNTAKAPTYTIGKLGSYYYMQNGTGAKTYDYRSTNCTKVAEFASGNISALGTGGGSIFFRAGNYYDLKWILEIPDRNFVLNLIGEGSQNTVLHGYDDADANGKAILTSNVTAWNPGGLYYYRYVNIYGIGFNCTQQMSYGIYLPYTSTFIHDVYVAGNLNATSATTGSNYVNLGGSAPPAYPSVIDGLLIITDSTHTNASTLPLLTWFEGVQINSMTIQSYCNLTYLWRLLGPSTHVSKLNIYTHNDVRTTTAVIYILGTSGGETDVFESITVANGTGTNAYGTIFKCASDFTGNVTVNNIYAATTWTLVSDAKTSASMVFHGHQFEAWGNGTIASAANHVHITNPLQSTPSYVMITSMNSTAPALSYTKSATEFIVTQASATGAGVFSYYAVYQP